MNNTITLPTVKLSKNVEDNEFLNAFVYHNANYFIKCIQNNVKKIYTIGSNPKAPICKGNDQNIGIHYETGPWKWGSVGTMNKFVKRGHVTIAKDHNNDCYCLDATAKLVNKILTEIWKNI